MSAVGPQFHEFIKKLEENNDKLPASITSRTFQPEFEFNNSNCYLCNGYYGPSFGEPVCVTCHAFLYPDIPSNQSSESSYIFSETDDGDSGNDEPSELLYNDRRLTRALQLGLAPTWALRHENSLDSETSPEDEASRPTAAANAAGPSRIIRPRGHMRAPWPSRNRGRGQGGPSRDQVLGSAGPSRENGPTRDHGMCPPGPSSSRDISRPVKDHSLGLAGQSGGTTRDHGMGSLGPGSSIDNSGPAKDHQLVLAGHSRDSEPPRDHAMGSPGPSSMDNSGPTKEHGLGLAGQSREHSMDPPGPEPRNQSSTDPNESRSRNDMGIPDPSRDVSGSAAPFRDHGAQRDASLDSINPSRDNEVGPTGQRDQEDPAEENKIENVLNPEENVVGVGADPIPNQQEEIPLPPWSVARTLAALSTPRLPDNLAPGLVEQLPSEVLLCMFSYLDDLSLCACALVCARWWRLVRARVSQARWRDYAQRRWPLLNCMVNVLDWHKKYQSLVESCFCRHCLVQMCVLWQPPYEENAWRRNRLRNELKMLRNDPPEGCAATPLDPKCCHWQAMVTGPVGSPYEGGVFYLYIQVPYSYPMSPPVVRFLTRILHPNVSRHGDVGIDSVHHNWSLALTLSKVLISIQSLLTDPYTAVCMEPAVGEMYVQDRVRFERIARRWTWRYAMHDVLANS